MKLFQKIQEGSPLSIYYEATITHQVLHMLQAQVCISVIPSACLYFLLVPLHFFIRVCTTTAVELRASSSWSRSRTRSLPKYMKTFGSVGSLSVFYFSLEETPSMFLGAHAWRDNPCLSLGCMALRCETPELPWLEKATKGGCRESENRCRCGCGFWRDRELQAWVWAWPGSTVFG